jgi:hypothetical protein
MHTKLHRLLVDLPRKFYDSLLKFACRANPWTRDNIVETSDNTPDSELRERLLYLPQELHDLILTFTFTADPETRLITTQWRPPIMLQLSKSTRRM